MDSDPAFHLPLDALIRLSRALAERAGDTAEVSREPIHGGTLSLEDATTLVSYTPNGDEVRRSDLLISVMVDMETVSHLLVALSFEEREKSLRCAVTGMTVRRPQP